MHEPWARAQRVGGRVLTIPFLVLSGLAAVGMILVVVREFIGLGATTGLNDGYSWGLFKNFNVTTLTALGSSGYAVGLLTWLFNRRKYHVIMRTAALISILAYTSALIGLGADLGRPWNFIWIVDPVTWNRNSVLLEVAICMTAYVLLGLQMENLPAFVERFIEGDYPQIWRTLASKVYRVVRRIYPFMIALAFVLPSMHQSSLGSLMMLAGPRVHPLWQSPILPFLYLFMAYTLGFAAVIGILMVSCMIWKRPLDMRILSRLGYVTSFCAMIWMAFYIGDIAGRGRLGLIFKFDFYSFWFFVQTLLILVPMLILQKAEWRENPSKLYMSLVVMTVGGLLYRYIPTTIAFIPGDHYKYWPTIPELLMSGGFVALAIIGYLYTVKRYNILPVPMAYVQKNGTAKATGVQQH
jgi:Ni/Fe-hydrogenase subunit HybB-like protein